MFRVRSHNTFACQLKRTSTRTSWLLGTAVALALAATTAADARHNGRRASARPQTIALLEPEAVAASDRPAIEAERPPVAAGAQFFTINEVLARRQGRTPPAAPVRLAAVDSAAVAVDTPNPLGTVETRTSEPFGLFSFRAPEGTLWTKWRKVEAEIKAEAPELAACRFSPDVCSDAGLRFNAIIDGAKKLAGRERIALVNSRINDAIVYTSDWVQHHVADLWSAPLATFSTGRGDCEDYAIAKYVALREAGTPVEDLRIMLVRDNVMRYDHAVLAVRSAEDWLILDNRWAAPRAQSDIWQFTPLFTLDNEGVKLVAAPYSQKPQRAGAREAARAVGWSDPENRLSDSKDLLQLM
jgi:predicted transglutaminase-like cysteine proteinase